MTDCEFDADIVLSCLSSRCCRRRHLNLDSFIIIGLYQNLGCKDQDSESDEGVSFSLLFISFAPLSCISFFLKLYLRTLVRSQQLFIKFSNIQTKAPPHSKLFIVHNANQNNVMSATDILGILQNGLVFGQHKRLISLLISVFFRFWHEWTCFLELSKFR